MLIWRVLQVYFNLSLKWIPKTTRKSNAKRRALWLTSEILDLTRSKTCLWKLNQAISWKNASLLKDCKQTRDIIKKEFLKARGDFELNLPNEKRTQNVSFHTSIINKKQKPGSRQCSKMVPKTQTISMYISNLRIVLLIINWQQKTKY